VLDKKESIDQSLNQLAYSLQFATDDGSKDIIWYQDMTFNGRVHSKQIVGVNPNSNKKNTSDWQISVKRECLITFFLIDEDRLLIPIDYLYETEVDLSESDK